MLIFDLYTPPCMSSRISSIFCTPPSLRRFHPSSSRMTCEFIAAGVQVCGATTQGRWRVGAGSTEWQQARGARSSPPADAANARAAARRAARQPGIWQKGLLERKPSACARARTPGEAHEHIARRPFEVALRARREQPATHAPGHGGQAQAAMQRTLSPRVCCPRPTTPGMPRSPRRGSASRRARKAAGSPLPPEVPVRGVAQQGRPPRQQGGRASFFLGSVILVISGYPCFTAENTFRRVDNTPVATQVRPSTQRRTVECPHTTGRGPRPHGHARARYSLCLLSLLS